MKLLNRDEFLKLPAGTLYAKYDREYLFAHIHAKYDSNSSGDFYTAPLIPISTDKFNDDYDLTSESFVATKRCELDFDCCGRDGYFDDDQLFAVFEAKELSRMTQILQTGLRLSISAEKELC